MKIISINKIMLFLVLALLLNTPVIKADELIPLKHGIYVREPDSCNQLTSANMTMFDGHGFGGGHTTAKIIDVRKNGNIYFITEKVQGTDPGEKPYTRKMKVTVINKTSFSTSDVYNEGQPPYLEIEKYRWCKPLPPGY